MALTETEARLEAPSDNDTEPSAVEQPDERERSVISQRISRHGAYDRLEG